jgi:hypothetical protein
MDAGQQRRRFRLWHCLEAVCAMEPRLEEMGRAEPFKRDFRFLRGCMARANATHCEEGELQSLERAIQMLLLELRDLLQLPSSEWRACMGRY